MLENHGASLQNPEKEWFLYTRIPLTPKSSIKAVSKLQSLETFNSSVSLGIFLPHEGILQKRGRHKKKWRDPSQEILSKNPQDGKGHPGWGGALAGLEGNQSRLEQESLEASARSWGWVCLQKMMPKDPVCFVVLRDCYFCREVSDELGVSI